MQLELNSTRKSFWFGIIIFIISLDQLIKYAVTQYFELRHTYPLLPSLNITLAHNEGIAFSFFDYSTDFNRWMLISIALLISLFLIGWLLHLGGNQKLQAFALVLIIGGAFGNIIDRAVFGFVRDYVDFYVSNWHFPIFNFADSVITIGTLLLIYDIFKNENSTC